MGHLLDDVARAAVADPMTRSRALKLLGGAVAAAVLPGNAYARSDRDGFRRARRRSGEACPPNQEPCPAVPACCDTGWYCADMATHACCPNGRQYCGHGTNATCCPPHYECANDKPTCCPPGKRCGSTCCLFPGQVCHRGKCVKCDPGTHKCGHTKCCSSKERCCGQVCCQSNQGCCGDICCDKGQHCCEGKICCNKGEQCCGENCCGKNTQCAVTPKGEQVCCPNIRAAHIGGDTVVCCPHGFIAGGSEGDRCCPTDRPGCAACVPPCGPGAYCQAGLCFTLA